MFDLLLLLPLPRVEAPSSVPEELPVSARFSTPPDRFTPPDQIKLILPSPANSDLRSNPPHVIWNTYISRIILLN